MILRESTIDYYMYIFVLNLNVISEVLEFMKIFINKKNSLKSKNILYVKFIHRTVPEYLRLKETHTKEIKIKLCTLYAITCEFLITITFFFLIYVYLLPINK